jgi:hypothetical protein
MFPLIFSRKKISTIFAQFSSKWCSAILCNLERAKLKDFLSASIQFQSGVPQGSHLGPIFVILHFGY